MSNNIIKNAAVNVVGTALYIVTVASFMSYTPHLFAEKDGGDPKTVLVPIVMLLLFVLSAAITGSLVFGRPVLWYLDGQKKEAISLLAHTLGFLFVIMIIAMFTLYMIVR